MKDNKCDHTEQITHYHTNVEKYLRECPVRYHEPLRRCRQLRKNMKNSLIYSLFHSFIAMPQRRSLYLCGIAQQIRI